MALRTFAIYTESEADSWQRTSTGIDPPEDGRKSKSADELSSSDNENSAPDDEGSDLGQECRRRQRIPWQLSGLTFLARQKKKPTHLGMLTLASTKSCDKGQGTVRPNVNSIFVFLSVEMTRCLYCECSGLQLSIVSSVRLSSQVTRHSTHPASNNGMCKNAHGDISQE